jgi:hypothetical protein
LLKLFYNPNRTKLEKADTPEFRERERFAAQIAETISRVSIKHTSMFYDKS